jgi:hypothetical protein
MWFHVTMLNFIVYCTYIGAFRLLYFQCLKVSEMSFLLPAYLFHFTVWWSILLLYSYPLDISMLFLTKLLSASR